MEILPFSLGNPSSFIMHNQYSERFQFITKRKIEKEARRTLECHNVTMDRKGKETTVEEKKIILNLHSMNKSYRDIAKITQRSRFTVRSIIKRLKSKANIEDQSRSGRPTKLTIREKRKIINIVKRDRSNS